MKHLVWILVLAAFAPIGAGANGISVSQALDKTDIGFEDSVRFTITLKWPGPQSAYLIEGPLDPEFKKLKVSGLSSSVSSTGTGASEQTEKAYHYTLVPLSPGEGRIEPLAVDYVTYPESVPGSLSTEPMIVTIAKPEPIPEQGRSYSMFWIWVIAGLVVAGVVGIIIFLRIIRRKDVGTEVVKSPREIALEQIDDLQHSVGDDMKRFQTGLYRILAGYLQAEYGIKADESEDDELRETFEELPIPEGRKETLTEWVLEARRDKFRPVDSPPGETVRRAAEVRAFFEKM